jgi:uncharacterized protein
MRKIVVLDTNLVVSAFLNPEGTASQGLQKALRYFDLVTSKETLGELLEVLRRDKFDRYARKEDRAERLSAYSDATLKFSVIEQITDCKDPKDNQFLALALAAKASLLVTGDKKDLLSMHPYRDIDIVSVRDFVDKFHRYL